MALPDDHSTKAQIKQAWGEWLTEIGDANGGWDWWATLTFRDPPPETPGWTKIGWQYAMRARDRFVREVGLNKGLHDLSWVFGTEIQPWRGVPHFHGLLAGVSELRRDDAWAWWFKEYGLARILPYDRSLGAGFYLCKYVTKELSDIRFSPGIKKVA